VLAAWFYVFKSVFWSLFLGKMRDKNTVVPFFSRRRTEEEENILWRQVREQNGPKTDLEREVTNLFCFF